MSRRRKDATIIVRRYEIAGMVVLLMTALWILVYFILLILGEVHTAASSPLIWGFIWSGPLVLVLLAGWILAGHTLATLRFFRSDASSRLQEPRRGQELITEEAGDLSAKGDRGTGDGSIVLRPDGTWRGQSTLAN